ncbi:MAG: amino acid adenylation domain-containing protein [Lachnospiraceae bacterium]|nr:amino acid adenylation domain-containing protein [Lachnospiraceae bacterium]
MDGIKIRLNSSREAIAMNDLAFPDSAINTVGFRLTMPETKSVDLKEAFERVAAKTVLLHLELAEEGGVHFLRDAGKAVSGVLHRSITEADADEEWDNDTRTPLPPASWKAKVYALPSGGSTLFFLVHHLLLDGYTCMQLAQLVLDEVNGEVTDPEEIDYARFPEDDLNAEDHPSEENKNFWMHYFDGVQNEASVMRGDPEGCERLRFSWPVPAGLMKKINFFEEENDIKDSGVFGAALSIWLARSAGTSDGVFLMPRLARDDKSQRSALDCKTLVVPVRNRIREDDRFTGVCRQSMRQATEASAHKRYGLKNIIGDLHASGILSGSISEYVLNCIHGGKLRSKAPFSIIENMSGGMSNHLTIAVQRIGCSINMIYDARAGIYDEEKTRYFNDALLYIIEQGISGDVTIGDMEIVGGAERDRVLEVKGDDLRVSSSDSIADLFRRSVERFKDRPAVYAGDVSYTYEELDRVSNRIACALIDRGVKQGEPVLYKLGRDHRLIPALIGIIKSGAAFIPLDPQYPEKRISYIIRDSGSSRMIVSAETKGEDGDIEYLDIDELMQFEDEADPELSIPQDQLAYSIYTSGTTGNPKGVLLTHKGIVNITDPGNNPFNREVVKNGKGIVAIGSVCFDISLFEFFVPLFNGCFIELAPESAMADPKALADLILKHGANLIHCTPSRIAAYLREESFSNALNTVDAILSAGEVLPKSLIVMLRDTYGVHIYNGYGPTETTIGATITEDGDDLSIGRPIANTGVMILDARGRLLPFGVPGEICIYGNGVGIGYHNLKSETEKRFVECFGRRMYRTGDLGRFFDDGRIEYHGRNDFQVKVRGLRIELAEVENCMMSYQGVSAACAQVRNMYGRDTLIGFYTKSNGREVDEAAFREYMSGRLPSYMVPGILKQIDEMPTTPGGKLDLKKLQQIQVDYVSNYRAPENEYQQIICDAFAKVLDIDRVSIDDSFFEIGGDSLHTAEIIHTLTERLPGLKLEFGDIFKYPVPESLAQFIYRQFAELKEAEDNIAEKLDYTGIDLLLSKNVLPEGKPGTDRRYGNVLLTGATGFLGLHVLMELIKDDSLFDNIYCLIRPTKRLNPEQRLTNLLFYFESAECEELIGERIFAVPGDISTKKIFDEDPGVRFDTVINCAADVKHYATDDKLDRVNTEGVRNLISLCEKDGASLVQVSTISVSGFYRSGSESLLFDEKSLYVGQIIDNRYIISKYMAEYECLKAMSEGRVHVKIMRVGNLQGRLSDGEFQLNKNTNAFTRRLVSYVKIGRVPQSVYDSSVNFSPVDEVARMICSLTRLPEDYTVFHVSPDKEVPMKLLFDSLKGLGHEVLVVPDDEFEEYTGKLREDKEGRVKVEGLLADVPGEDLVFTAVSQSFTDEMIKKAGLSWGEITEDYLVNYLTVLDEFGMFEGEGL